MTKLPPISRTASPRIYTIGMEAKDFILHRILKRPYRLILRTNAGQGKPVVLLHGLASNGDAWKHFVAQADLDKFQIVAFDLLGFGYSPKPQWLDYNVEHHSRAVAASIKRLKLKQPVILVGHSMGCLVAIRIAAQYPKLVHRAILYEPPLFVDLPEYRSHSRYRKGYFTLYRKVANNPEAVLRYAQTLGRAATRLPGHNLSHEIWLPFERSLRNTIMGQTAYYELLRAKLPIDIVYGRLDMIVSRSEIRKMFKYNPNISFHMVNDSHSISARTARFLINLLDNPKS